MTHLMTKTAIFVRCNRTGIPKMFVKVSKFRSVSSKSLLYSI